MTTLLDTSVVISLIKATDKFHPWAMKTSVQKRLDGPLAITDITYCEASIVFAERSQFDLALRELGIDRISATNEALFIAGKAYHNYKKAQKHQTKKGVLPDYMIGAVAIDEQVPLMTSNPGDFRKYFEDIVLIEPPEELMAAKTQEEIDAINNREDALY